jgi:YrbI family 3-deoxy-D-manno-octulosonate 8-phosphate phosphatase
MPKKIRITLEYLRSILHYDPKTGIFTWKTRTDVPKEWNTRFAGSQAGSDDKNGRWKILINGYQYRANRLAWFYVYGVWPPKKVDHKNRNSFNDELKNLRLATNSQNAGNSKIPKILFTDFDGCLTDDRVWLNQEGEEFVAANRKDGLAVKRLKNLGIQVVIASTETNKVVLARGNNMGVDVLQGLADKAEAIEQYLEQKNLSWNDIWYIGNDVNDLGAIERSNLSICPADAVKKVRKSVDVVLKTKGGYGILSEIATLLEQ